jgi:hypothetical protein
MKDEDRRYGHREEEGAAAEEGDEDKGNKKNKQMKKHKHKHRNKSLTAKRTKSAIHALPHCYIAIRRQMPSRLSVSW